MNNFAGSIAMRMSGMDWKYPVAATSLESLVLKRWRVTVPANSFSE
jgi:hypothetical protein